MVAPESLHESRQVKGAALGSINLGKDIPGYFTTGSETLRQLETGRSGIFVATQSLKDIGGDDAIQQALLMQPDLATLPCAEDDGLLVQPSSD